MSKLRCGEDDMTASRSELRCGETRRRTGHASIVEKKTTSSRGVKGHLCPTSPLDSLKVCLQQIVF
ncbi:hypothetical protein YC2023_001974 [Brassica napus]